MERARRGLVEFGSDRRGCRRLPTSRGATALAALMVLVGMSGRRTPTWAERSRPQPSADRRPAADADASAGCELGSGPAVEPGRGNRRGRRRQRGRLLQTRLGCIRCWSTRPSRCRRPTPTPTWPTVMGSPRPTTAPVGTTCGWGPPRPVTSGGLLRFDLSQVPKNATVSRADLQLVLDESKTSRVALTDCGVYRPGAHGCQYQGRLRRCARRPAHRPPGARGRRGRPR